MVKGAHEIRTGVFSVSLSLRPYAKNEAYTVCILQTLSFMLHISCSHQPSALKMDMLMNVSLQECLATKHNYSLL